MKPLFLGIDLGTSAMKLVLIDERRNVIAQSTESYQELSVEQEWNEIDTCEWVLALKRGVKSILAEVDGKRIQSIGVTGQMHTLVVLDKEGKPLRPAIMWNDTRTKKLISGLREKFQYFEEGAYLAKQISTGSPAANLFWISKYEPDNFEKINKFLIAPDYLVYILTGQYVTDYSEASTSCLFNTEKKCWSEEVMHFIGLQEDMYPDIKGSACFVGSVKSDLAMELGLGNQVSVITGTGDNPASLLSTDCFSTGMPVLSLGTSGVFVTPIYEMKQDGIGKVIVFSFQGDDFTYLVQGAVQSNGSTLNWFLHNILGSDNYDDISEMICIADMAKNDLLFYPHLNGEKTIYGDSDLKGAFIGLELQYQKEDMLYAVLEGLSFAFKELIEKMLSPSTNVGCMKVIGGGAKSDVWLQILANVLNVKLIREEDTKGPSFGIALLAAHSSYIGEERQMPESNLEKEMMFNPQADYVPRMQEKYKKYLKIRQALKMIEE